MKGPHAGSSASQKADRVYRHLFENGPEGVFQTTPEGRFLLANPALAKILGRTSPDELIASVTNIREQLYADPRQAREFERLMREVGSVSGFEAELIRADGTRIWIAVNAHATTDESGSALHYEGTVEEITQWKRAEQALRQEEEKWRALVETSGESIVIADEKGAVLFTNEKPNGEASEKGRDVYDGLAASGQERLRRALGEAFATGKAQYCEAERRNGKGRPQWCEMRVVPIGQTGSIERVILIGADVTTRRRTEEALRESQRFIARVAETSPAILYVYDLMRRSYVYVNHQVTKILGFTTADFLQMGGSFAEKLVHPEDAEMLAERGQKLATVDDGVVVECTFRMLSSSGAWLWIRAREAIFTRTAEGRAEQIIGMAEDVTQRRTSRLELERSREQLRALSARLHEAREAEAAAISRRVHDELGQTLTALNMDLARTRQALTASPEPDGAVVSERLHGMEELVAGMLTTVRKLASELRPPMLDQFGLVAAIQWQAGEFQKRYGIACTVNANWRTAFENQSAGTAVFRILQEILTNVARHAQAKCVIVTLHEGGPDLMMVVRDDGCGITPGQESESLGILGMRERALLFGGRVEITGSPERGTVVSVHIPRSQVAAWAAPRKETLLPERRRGVQR